MSSGDRRRALSTLQNTLAAADIKHVRNLLRFTTLHWHVLYCTVLCCGVMWCGVVCCVVLWCGVMSFNVLSDTKYYPFYLFYCPQLSSRSIRYPYIICPPPLPSHLISSCLFNLPISSSLEDISYCSTCLHCIASEWFPQFSCICLTFCAVRLDCPHHRLTHAQEGDVDGFCVLQCLLESGFKIPRGDR